MARRKEDLSILGIVERLSDSLSGGTLEDVLDGFILESISRIITHTTLCERMLAEMLPLVIVNTRRRISLHDNAHVTDLIFTFLMEKDAAKRIKLFTELRLERTVPFHIIKTFSEQVKHYAANVFKTSGDNADYDKVQAQGDIHKRIGFKDEGKSLYHVIREVEFYAVLAYEFRAMLMEKYVRYAFMAAKKHKRMSGLDIDLDQLFKDLLIGVARGIDKYHSEKGTLTSCVKWWMQDAATQNSSTHENGISYHVPTPRREKHLAKGGYNFAIEISEKNVASLETPSLETEFIAAQEKSYFARIAAQADKNKVSFLLRGLTMPLNEAEKQKLRSTMRKQA